MKRFFKKKKNTLEIKAYKEWRKNDLAEPLPAQPALAGLLVQVWPGPLKPSTEQPCRAGL